MTTSSVNLSPTEDQFTNQRVSIEPQPWNSLWEPLVDHLEEEPDPLVAYDLANHLWNQLGPQFMHGLWYRLYNLIEE